MAPYSNFFYRTGGPAQQGFSSVLHCFHQSRTEDWWISRCLGHVRRPGLLTKLTWLLTSAISVANKLENSCHRWMSFWQRDQSKEPGAYVSHIWISLAFIRTLRTNKFRGWHSHDTTRSRPNWITGPGPKSGSAGKSESRGPENGVSRWRRPNSDIYSQNYHFGLVYDMIYQFLGMEAKTYKFGMFCQQCHPSLASGDADIQPRNASRIHTCHLFTSQFCLISNLEYRGDKSPDQNF